MSKTNTHGFHLRRLMLFTLLFAAFFIVRADAGALPKPLTPSNVLAYATDMSLGGLLSATNQYRAANGQPSLKLDSQLNSSAQAKAQDMASKNYWAHVSPDGTQPWYFFTQAGYAYTKAGENLAYGFSTSQGTVDGWMNSASHRANMLDNYYDVGFGIVNAPDYQSSGAQTIVVAHYGVRTMAPAAPTQSAPPAPTQEAAPPSELAPAPAPAAEPVPEATAQPETPVPSPSEETVAKPAESPAQPAPVATAQQSRTSLLGMLTNRTAPIAGLISLVLLCVAITGYALTHRAAFQHAVTVGERFAIKHPGIDASVIAAVSMLILLTSYGTVG